MSSSNANASTTSEQQGPDKDNDVHNVSDRDNENETPSTTSSRHSPNSNQLEEEEEHHQAQLTVYDLSRGMAKSLSAQLLGPDHSIDVVPHTGVVVFGKEYFFGQSVGLSAESPDHFRTTRGMEVLQILDLGTTTVSASEFEDWIQSMTTSPQSDFHATKYNLFDNNCNHFSQRAIQEGLRISSTPQEQPVVPQWILDVPQKVLASPMGPMLRPVLENMQVSGGVPFAPDETSTTDGGEDAEKNKKNAPEVDDDTTTTKTKTEKLHPRQDDDGDSVTAKSKEEDRSSTNSYNQPPPLKSLKEGCSNDQ